MVTVTVTADEDGNVVGVSENNPDYGYIRVETISTQIDNEGWLKNVKRSALIKGKVTDLVEVGYKEFDEIPGRIVVRESLEPFNPENPDKNLKIAGNTGIICRVHDEPIYRQTFFTSNLNDVDELIMHTNKEEIKEVMGAQRELNNISQAKIKKTSGKKEVEL